MNFRLAMTHAYPVDVGILRLHIQADAVKELSLQHNPSLSDDYTLAKVLHGFPNLREVYIGETNFKLSKVQIKEANSNIKFIKTKPL